MPDDAGFEHCTDPQQQMELAVGLAETFATNVPPVTVPEAAGRARQSEVQADLAHCMLAFLTPTSAVIALATGQLLQLVVLVRLLIELFELALALWV
jgi:hypothetical protein